jgi:hypothetical protein
MNSCQSREGRRQGLRRPSGRPAACAEHWERALGQWTRRQPRRELRGPGQGFFGRDPRGHDGVAGDEHRRRTEARRRVRLIAGRNLFRGLAAGLRRWARALLWPREGSRVVRCRRKRAAEAPVERPFPQAFFYAVSTSLASIYACRACNILRCLWAITALSVKEQSAMGVLGSGTKC